MGSLKRALIVLNIASTSYHNRSTYAMNIGWVRILPLEINCISKLQNKL